MTIESGIQVRLGNTGYWVTVRKKKPGNHRRAILIDGEKYFFYYLPHSHGNHQQYGIDWPDDKPLPSGAYKK